MKKGFTLIELLAVIVILAIIALIATPIILGIINDAREKANARSVELYASAVRNAAATYQLTNAKAPIKFSDLNVQYDGNVECTVEELYADGSFYLEGCKVNNGKKEYSYGIDLTPPVCTIEKQGVRKYSIGDIVTCVFPNSTEQFYVIENEDEDTTEGIDILSMYNLDVGNSYDANSLVLTPLEKTTGIQSSTAKGWIDDDSIRYGVVAFSSQGYWVDSDEQLLNKYGNDYPAYVYNENSNLYQYVSAYEKYLKENGVSSASAKLLSYEQAKYLKNNKGNPAWLYETTYWLGSAYNASYTFLAFFDGAFYSDDCDYDSGYGVRPVITISTSELKS